jgi:hypothetical protein
VFEVDTGGGGFGIIDSLGTRVAGDATVGDVVGGLSTDEESVTTEDGVSGECWPLKQDTSEYSRRHVLGLQIPDLENVEESAGVEARLLVNGSQQGRLAALLRQQSGGKVELQTLGNLVPELKLCEARSSWSSRFG